MDGLDNLIIICKIIREEQPSPIINLCSTLVDVVVADLGGSPHYLLISDLFYYITHPPPIF